MATVIPGWHTQAADTARVAQAEANRNPLPGTSSSSSSSSGSGIGSGLISTIAQYLDPAKQTAALDAWQTGQQGILDKNNATNMQRISGARGLSPSDPYAVKLANELAQPAQAALGQQRLTGEMNYRQSLIPLLFQANAQAQAQRTGGSSGGGSGGSYRGGGSGLSGGGGGGGRGDAPRPAYDPSQLGGMIGSGYALASNIIGSPNPSTFQWGSGQHIGETYGEMTGQGPRRGDPSWNNAQQYERGNALGHAAAGYHNGAGGAPDPRSTMQPPPAQPPQAPRR